MTFSFLLKKYTKISFFRVLVLKQEHNHHHELSLQTRFPVGLISKTITQWHVETFVVFVALLLLSTFWSLQRDKNAVHYSQQKCSSVLNRLFKALLGFTRKTRLIALRKHSLPLLVMTTSICSLPSLNVNTYYKLYNVFRNIMILIDFERICSKVIH